MRSPEGRDAAALSLEAATVNACFATLLGIEGTIDGLWQSLLIGPPGFRRQRAIAAVLELVDGIFPADDDT